VVLQFFWQVVSLSGSEIIGRLDWRIVNNQNAIIVIQSLVIKVLKLGMNHANLNIRNAKSFSVHQAFNGMHLVKQHRFNVLLFHTPRFQIILQKLVLKLVMTSLSQSEIQNSTHDFEQVFGVIFIGWLALSEMWFLWAFDLNV